MGGDMAVEKVAGGDEMGRVGISRLPRVALGCDVARRGRLGTVVEVGAGSCYVILQWHSCSRSWWPSLSPRGGIANAELAFVGSSYLVSRVGITADRLV